MFYKLMEVLENLYCVKHLFGNHEDYVDLSYRSQLLKYQLEGEYVRNQVYQIVFVHTWKVNQVELTFPFWIRQEYVRDLRRRQIIADNCILISLLGLHFDCLGLLVFLQVQFQPRQIVE